MKQVLYVEDSKMAQALMRKYITGLCELTILSTLAEALEMVRVRSFDLIVLDFRFPDGDSIGLIEEIRTVHPLETLPIIVVSASVDRLLMAQLLRAGANNVFSKPIVVEQFRAVVERLLHEPYVRPAAESGDLLVTCFQWRGGGSFHQYCPELNLSADGPTKEEAADRMKLILERYAEAGAELGVLSQEGIARHLIDRE